MRAGCRVGCCAAFLVVPHAHLMDRLHRAQVERDERAVVSADGGRRSEPEGTARRLGMEIAEESGVFHEVGCAAEVGDDEVFQETALMVTPWSAAARADGATVIRSNAATARTGDQMREAARRRRELFL